jgi:predicted regulator of Ras-like GTPase activity (Roadblock/LC7/MglB family)
MAAAGIFSNFREVCVLKRILEDLLSSVTGARAAVFLDGDGEAIVHAGDGAVDMKLLGAWKEIHLDHIRDIAKRLRLGDIHAVLFSLDEGNELVVPVSGEYCLLLFLSTYAQVQEAMAAVKKAVELLKKEVE